MMGTTRRGFLKSAACFSVLCALGTGLGVGNLMASVDGFTQQQSVSISVSNDFQSGSLVVNTNTDMDGTKVSIGKTNTTQPVLSMDLGSVNTAVSVWTNGSPTLMANSASQGLCNIINSSCKVENLFTGQSKVAIATPVSCQDCINAVRNTASAYKLSTAHPGFIYTGDSENESTTYHLMSIGVLSDASVNDLNDSQLKDLKNAVKKSYEARALRIWNNYPQIQNFMTNAQNSQNGGVISLTCSDSIKGEEKGYFLDAIKCVSIANGDVSKLDEVQQQIEAKTLESKLEFRVMSQSVAAEIGCAYQFAKGESAKDCKIVTVNCGESGFSICGGKLEGKDLTLKQDQYVEGYGGKAIDDGIVELIGAKCKSDGYEAGFSKYLQNKKSKLLKSVKEAKHLLSALGCDSVKVELKGIQNSDDLELTITRDELNTVLENKGILSNLKKVFSDYVATNLEGIGVGDRVIFVGGSLRIPMLQSALAEVSNGALLCNDVNFDAAAVCGAACAAAGCSVGEVNNEKLEPVSQPDAETFMGTAAPTSSDTSTESLEIEADAVGPVVVDSSLARTLRAKVQHLNKEVSETENLRNEAVEGVRVQLEEALDKLINEGNTNMTQILQQVNQLSEISGIQGGDLSESSGASAISERILQLQSNDGEEVGITFNNLTQGSNVSTQMRAHFKTLQKKLVKNYGERIKQHSSEFRKLLIGAVVSDSTDVGSNDFLESLNDVWRYNSRLAWMPEVVENLESLLKTSQADVSPSEATNTSSTSASTVVVEPSSSDETIDTTIANESNTNISEKNIVEPSEVQTKSVESTQSGGLLSTLGSYAWSAVTAPWHAAGWVARNLWWK